MLKTRAATVAKWILFGLEGATVGVLTLLVIVSIFGLVLELPAVAQPPFLGAEQLGHVVDHILAVFILIELLVTAVAYIRGQDIVRRVFEVMLVALARKLISIDLATSSLEKSGALSLLLVAVGTTWLLIRSRTERKRATETSSDDRASVVDG